MATLDLMGFDDLQSKTAVAKEHALAVTRDYISQPRLSSWCQFLAVWIVLCSIIVPSIERMVCAVCFASSLSIAYRTVSGVNGPLVILDQVKVRALLAQALTCMYHTRFAVCSSREHLVYSTYR